MALFVSYNLLIQDLTSKDTVSDLLFQSESESNCSGLVLARRARPERIEKPQPESLHHSLLKRRVSFPEREDAYDPTGRVDRDSNLDNGVDLFVVLWELSPQRNTVDPFENVRRSSFCVRPLPLYSGFIAPITLRLTFEACRRRGGDNGLIGGIGVPLYRIMFDLIRIRRLDLRVVGNNGLIWQIDRFRLRHGSGLWLLPGIGRMDILRRLFD